MAALTSQPRASQAGDMLEMTDHVKETGVVTVETDLESEEPANGFKSTNIDAADMQRMGKDQQLMRHFRILSMASFVAIATATWEMGLFAITPGLLNGGLPGLVYSVLWSFIGFGPIYLSMAEMASMAPIAGAQYHWVSEFAPESLQRGLSYLTGWTSTMAWQAGNALGVFLVGTTIQCIISLHDVTYTFPAWHATLISIGAVCIAFCGNVYGHKVLHLWQNVVFAIHILAYFGLIIPIWVNAPRASTKQVFTEFSNRGGWSSTGLAVLAGQITGIGSQLGIDTAGHMAEEVKNASRAVPKVMISVWIINFCLMFPALITVVYHIPDIDEAFADPTAFPLIYVLRQSMSNTWLTVLLTVMVALILCSNMSYLAAVTRDIWSFARDQGFPCSDWIGRVDEKRHIPVNAVIVTSCCSIGLSLIYIGSPVAFYAIVSLLAVALLQCYCLSIGCILWRRIVHPETLPPARFSLGKLGIPLNILAICFALWSFFWAFWPTTTPVTAAGFNWASVLFTATLVVAGAYYAIKGRQKYFGPVVHVEGRKVHPS